MWRHGPRHFWILAVVFYEGTGEINIYHEWETPPVKNIFFFVLHLHSFQLYGAMHPYTFWSCRQLREWLHLVVEALTFVTTRCGCQSLLQYGGGYYDVADWETRLYDTVRRCQFHPRAHTLTHWRVVIVSHRVIGLLCFASLRGIVVEISLALSLPSWVPEAFLSPPPPPINITVLPGAQREVHFRELLKAVRRGSHKGNVATRNPRPRNNPPSANCPSSSPSEQTPNRGIFRA